MIFALIDLFRYRFRLQHYGDDPRQNLLALGHTHRVAEETLKVIAAGDIIICQRMDSLLSWAIMYFGGRYAVDHVAIYVGDGKVIHATLAGVKEHSIHALARGARVLPFSFYVDNGEPTFARPKSRFSQGDNASEPARNDPTDISHQDASPLLPPHLQLLLAGVAIVLGLRPTSFRWQYYWDIGITAALIDLLLWPINHFPMACTIWTAWLIVLIRLRIRFRSQLRSGCNFEPDSHPGLVVRIMMRRGGYIFPSRPVNGQWKVKVFPESAALSSRQQTAPQSQNQQSNQESSASDR